MKNRLIWYVDSLESPKGRQSNHVATVVIIMDTVRDTGNPYYRVGVAVKHPNDKLPFVKKDGRALATDRALEAAPCFSIGDAAIAAYNGIRSTPDHNVDINRLLANIQHVLNRMQRVA